MFEDTESDAMADAPVGARTDVVIKDRTPTPTLETTEGETVTIPPHPAHALVEEWFVRHFHGLGPHLTEYMHAKLHAAKEELKTLLSTLS